MRKVDQLRELSIMAHLEEYKALMGEISLRLRAQHTLLNVTVVLIGGGLAFLTIQIDTGNYAILLFLPVIFLIIVWWYVAYQLMIGQTAKYVYGPLSRKINFMLEADEDENRRVWRWLSYQYDEFESRTKNIYVYNTVNLVKYAPWFIPSVLSVLAFMSLRNLYGKSWQTFEIVLLAIDGFLWLGTFIGLLFFLGWHPPQKNKKVEQVKLDDEICEDESE